RKSILTKLMDIESCGESESWLDGPLSPPSEYDETRQSSSLIFMNSKPELLRSVSAACWMCLPVAHASIRVGDALLVAIETEKSRSAAFPVPPPPPVDPPPVFATPHEKDEISISPGCVLSVLSPSMPSIFRNASKAIAHLRCRECQVKLGRAVAAQL